MDGQDKLEVEQNLSIGRTWGARKRKESRITPGVCS